MIDTKFSKDRTLLTADELAGVNGGLLTGGCVPAPKPANPSGASPSAQGASMASFWNWGGSPSDVRRTN
jgi:hypothetical protein